VAEFFRSRDIYLPHGHPSDSPDLETACGIANKKNEAFRTLLARRGIRRAENVAEFISELRSHGIYTAVVSPSKNCDEILVSLQLLSAFDTIIDGYDIMELSLHGSPEPDAFTLAADNLRLLPSECMLAASSSEGMLAGRRGNFGMILGVHWGQDDQLLWENGADMTVESFQELSYDRVRQWFDVERVRDSWKLTYQGFHPEEEMLRESLTTVGNGYIGSRGAYCGSSMFADIHYPGTYVSGLWNTLGTEMHGRTIYNADFVNIPNWLLIELKIGDGGFCRLLGDCRVEDYVHSLDMRNGVTTRSMRICDRLGHQTRIETRQFVSMAEPHLAAVEFRFTPLNYSEPVFIRSTLDGTIMNYGVPRYRGLSKRHLKGLHTREQDGRIELRTRTNQSKIDIYMNARHTLTANGEEARPEVEVERGSAYVSNLARFQAQEGSVYVYRKVVSIYTSKDRDTDDPARDARELADAYGATSTGFDEAFARHAERWHQLWETADIELEPDRFSQRVLRLHIYHLLASHSPNSANQDVGFTARGLHGEAYRGHIFWDELFVQPFYNLKLPEVTRGHLMYRYRRLDAARRLAQEEGYEGAMYPWQSGDDGGEETQELHFNPQSGRWDPDLSRNQRHVSLAIAYDIWTYYYTTDDKEFMHQYGLEMLVEICRYWASRAHYDRRDGRYHIAGVMGPDEFHEKYPDAEEGGLRDNAYTNALAVWILHKTIETWKHQPEDVRKALKKRIGFKEESEIARWEEVASKLTVVIDKHGIISQYDGFRELKELDWEEYRRRYGNIRRLDRILKAEGDTPDRYQVCKQADTLMLFYLFSPGQVRHILEMMGYEVRDEQELVTRNYEYYLRRTSHGSTLSFIVHSDITRYVAGHRNEQWRWFMEALRSDIYDTQGGTTREAIHCGVMAGTLSTVLEGFAGINLFRDHVAMNPDLPRTWNRLAFKLLHRGNLFAFEVVPELIRVRKEVLPIDGMEDLWLQVGDQVYHPGAEIVEIPYQQQNARMPI